MISFMFSFRLGVDVCHFLHNSGRVQPNREQAVRKNCHPFGHLLGAWGLS